MAARRHRKRVDEQRAREEAWNRGLNQACYHSRKSEYNALYDANMRHFFEKEHLQLNLYRAGLIDKSGRVLDLSKNKSKLNVIENEFKQAERAELLRQKEEQEMRERVQKKRFDALEKAKREERILRTREDCRIRKEIVGALRHQAAPPVSQPARRKKAAMSAEASVATSVGGYSEAAALGGGKWGAEGGGKQQQHGAGLGADALVMATGA